jgi:hypothetical protein
MRIIVIDIRFQLDCLVYNGIFYSTKAASVPHRVALRTYRTSIVELSLANKGASSLGVLITYKSDCVSNFFSSRGNFVPRFLLSPYVESISHYALDKIEYRVIFFFLYILWTYFEAPTLVTWPSTFHSR